jgi:hypothetical protein
MKDAEEVILKNRLDGLTILLLWSSTAGSEFYTTTRDSGPSIDQEGFACVVIIKTGNIEIG